MLGSIIKMSLLSVFAFSCYCQLSAMEKEPDTPWECEPETPLEKNNYMSLVPIAEIFDNSDQLPDRELAAIFENNKRTREDLYDSDKERALDPRLKKNMN